MEYYIYVEFYGESIFRIPEMIWQLFHNVLSSSSSRSELCVLAVIIWYPVQYSTISWLSTICSTVRSKWKNIFELED